MSATRRADRLTRDRLDRDQPRSRDDRRRNRADRSSLYFALTLVALLGAIYLALQILGFLVKLAFIAAAVVLGVHAVRVWRGSS